MFRRVLLESVKFLSLRDLLLSVARVSRAVRSAVYAEEALLFFLNEEESASSLPLYERLKQQQLNRSPRHLLHVSDGQALIWHINSPLNAIVRVPQPEFTDSSRYALLSPTVAVVTGGVRAPRRCTLLDLAAFSAASGAELVECRSWHSSTALYGCVYVSGGNIKGQLLSSAEVFDGKRWEKIADMTTPRYNHTLCVYKSAVYAFAGSNIRPLESSAEFYDGVRWRLSPMKLHFPENYSDVLYYRQNLILLAGCSSRGLERYVYTWDEGGLKWNEVCRKPGEHSLSNAVTAKDGVCYFYDHSGDIYQFSLSV